MYEVKDDLAFYARKGVEKFDGMLNKSAAVVAALAATILKKEGRFNGQTVFLEIGVFKGKFFSLIEAASKGTTLGIVGVDPFIIEGQSLEEVRQSFVDAGMDMSRIALIEGYSTEAVRIISVVSAREIVLTHVDGSHREQDVYSDLAFLDEIIAEDGIVICDDFWNKSQLGVTTAVFRYILGPGNLKPFMLSNTKLYLCRGAHLSTYLKRFETAINENKQFSICAEWAEKRAASPKWHTEQKLSDFQVLLI